MARTCETTVINHKQCRRELQEGSEADGRGGHVDRAVVKGERSS